MKIIKILLLLLFCLHIISCSKGNMNSIDSGYYEKRFAPHTKITFCSKSSGRSVNYSYAFEENIPSTIKDSGEELFICKVVVHDKENKTLH